MKLPKALAIALTAALATACASDDTTADASGPDTTIDTPQTEAPSTQSRPTSSVLEKTIGESAYWGCPESGVTDNCILDFAITNISRVECEWPSNHPVQPGNHLIRVDLDVATTQALADDQSNALSTLLVNQWSAKTADGYTTQSLNEQPGCISGVDQSTVLQPDTKTRPTSIIEVPDNSTQLQIRPFGMDNGGGWSWSLAGV